jgi:hypothetical protein
MSGERNLLAEQAGLAALDAQTGASEGYVSPVGMVDLATMAANASASAKSIMQFEPMVAGMVSMFFPPAAIAQPFIVMAMPFVIRALDDLAKSNGGDMISAFLQLAQHLTKGMPNSPALAPLSTSTTASNPVSQNTPFSTADGLDASGNMTRADTPG